MLVKNSFIKILYLLVVVVVIVSNITRVSNVDASTVEELRRSIEIKNAQLELINEEIKELDGKILNTTQEGQTLKSTISTLEASRNKLLKEIQGTENQVVAANFTIEQLGLEIKKKENEIFISREALADSIRKIDRAENFSLTESVFTYKNISELWNNIETLDRFQVGIRDNISIIEQLKSELQQKRLDNENQKKNLTSLKNVLEDKKTIVDINKNQTSKLLSATKNKEAEFKKQLEEKKRLSIAFQKDLSDFESQLKFIIDPHSYPSAGSGVLRWPLDNIFLTQAFGDTDFARNNNAYNGKGHNGVDFRATIGTKVMSALSGIVEGTGNTDQVPGCYSYGQWVLIKHNNGLSTLYAHLSLIKVSVGQRVTTGETIGYSGNTGYSTGPHLHFGVYATQGVKILKYTNSVNCKNAIIPVADIRAYLNPLLYL